MRYLAALLLHLLLILPPPPACRAEDWPHWRGARRTGVIAEASGFEKGAWKTLRTAWKASLGAGSSAPLVANGKVYAMGWADDKETVVCLAAETGNLLWRKSYPAPQYSRFATGDQTFYSGPSATPEFDARTGFLYTLGIDGALHCWDTNAAGSKVWGFNLFETLKIAQRPQATRRGGSHRDYGWTCAPLVFGDWLVVEVGSEEGCLMAFDRRTGARRWASEAKGPAGHTGGMALLTVEGVPCVAVLTLKFLLVARLDGPNAGRTVATYDWVTDYANSMATPAVSGQDILVTSAWNHQAMVKLHVTLRGAKEVWKKRIYSSVGSLVVYKHHAYWADRGIHCLDLATREVVWEGNRFAYGSCIVTADGRLIVWGNDGELVLAETCDRSPKAYKELFYRSGLARTEAWPSPVLVGGRLYLRDRAGNLQVFLVRAN